MLIEVFGPGCAKCNQSADVAKTFLETQGLEGEVVKHSDLDVMTERGVLRTPTVIIDGEKIAEGRVLRAKDLQSWLERTAPDR